MNLLVLLLSCSTPAPSSTLPVSAKSAPRRPFSLGLDHLAEPGTWLREDHDHDGWSALEGDCDDTTGTYSPRMDEICNLVDDNCDGAVDEGCREDWIGAWAYDTFHATDGEVSSAEWGVIYADAAGTEWCRIEGTLVVEGPGRSNCPDCLWDFVGRLGQADAYGDACARIDAPWEYYWSPAFEDGWTTSSNYSYGYALSAYEYWLWYDGRYVSDWSDESVLLNSSLGWGVVWTNHDPSGRQEVFGDGTGNEVTAVWRWDDYAMPGGYTLSPE